MAKRSKGFIFVHDELHEQEKRLPRCRERQTRAFQHVDTVVSDELLLRKYGDVGSVVNVVRSLTGMPPIKVEALIIRHGDSIPLLNLTGGCDAV